METDEKELEKYIERWEKLKEYNEKSLEGLQEEIEQIKYEQKKLSSRSLQWLIENDSSENVLSKEVKDNKFLEYHSR